MNQDGNSDEQLLADAECARLYSVTPRTIWRWSKQGLIPGPVKVGGVSRWRRSEQLRHIEKLSEAERAEVAC
jgi:predicted DNA-binding transcriptional regulator AlpA